MEGLYTSGSTSATGGLVDVHAVQHRYSILCFDAENAYFHSEEDDEEVYCWPPKEWVMRYHTRGGRVERPWWMLKRQLYGRQSFEVQRVCRGSDRWSRHRAMPRGAITLPTTRNSVDLRVPPRRYVSGSNLELAWLQETLGARLKLKPVEPRGAGSQCSYLRATRTRVDLDTNHIAPRETYIKDVLDILGLVDNKCKPMPTPIV